MSILIPVVDTGITMNEIPHRIAYYMEIGNCQAQCKGCHSPHLHTPVKPTPLERLIADADHALDTGANALLLMGGTTNGIAEADLIATINALAELAPVGLYSGRADAAKDKALAAQTDLTWLKTGDYRPTRGGLTDPRTNQKFYRKEYEYTVNARGELVKAAPIFIDCTHEFRT